MKVLQYRGINSWVLDQKYHKLVEMLERNDFYAADVKKITGTRYYRAKLDYKNRLLFTLVTYKNQRFILILEFIYNHAYDRSRFLRNHKTSLDDKFWSLDNLAETNFEELPYLNLDNHYINVLDRLISFDEEQEQVFNLELPIMVIGSAGSGKTLLSLEKIKSQLGKILFVTRSAYLVKHARELYYANNYTNETQEVDFLSYQEFVESIKIPELAPIDLEQFKLWLQKYHSYQIAKDPNKLYEEFNGVLTADGCNKYLSLAQYLNLGVKQSVFNSEDRIKAYELFTKYLEFIANQGFYDSNILAYEYLSLVPKIYDLVVIDEVQDLSQVQLRLILNSLIQPQQFILCGDSNQIVHPNFFAWSKIKSLFYTDQDLTSITRTLHKSYRNSASVVNLANTLLKIKQARFGSIDRESNYLIQSCNNIAGNIYFLADTTTNLSKLNSKIANSTQFAIIVLTEEQKISAQQHFNTPLVFSIYEAKGLEYRQVILYNIISSEPQKFLEITKDVKDSDLLQELKYSRNKDKNDHSLEAYKFYINALYVAVTRTIEQIYIIENLQEHRLFQLLNLSYNLDVDTIQAQSSTLDEWQQEATKLELQGKKSQADLIKSKILAKTTPNWLVITTSELNKLQQDLINKPNDKELRLLLFEYAIIYQHAEILAKLAEDKFTPAIKLDLKKSWSMLEKKYYIGYGQNYNLLLKQIDLYGVNFRNLFNQTPLMIASLFGNISLVQTLVNKGADLKLLDNNGHNAWQITLAKALIEPHFAKHKLSALEPLIDIGELDLGVDNKLVKINKTMMEYLLVNMMIVMDGLNSQVNSYYFSKKIMFSILRAYHSIDNLPNSLVPEFRKKRAYIASVLAKNEVNSNHQYNRKLFCRLQRGCYTLNPQLKIKTNAGWISIYQLLNFNQ